MSEGGHKRRRKIYEPLAELSEYTAPCWLPTEEIEDELLSAEIAESRSGRRDADFVRVDAYFVAGGDETEAE